MKEVEIDKVIKKIVENGFEVAIVGGAVRSVFAKQGVDEWDLTTNAKPEEILKLFPKAYYNNRFGTVAIGQNGKNVVEITTYRKEANYTDSRHPDKVEWGDSLEEDLKRRDFTINAVALKIIKDKPAIKNKIVETDLLSYSLLVVDPFGGREDFKIKKVKAVGDADERFCEDPLRMLRAVRFAVSFEFDIEDETFASIKKNAKLLSKISGERIRDEIFKMIDLDVGAEGIFLCKQLGLLGVFMGELEKCFSVPQKSPKRHHIYDVGTHCVMSLKFCPSKDTITRFATLLHDIGKADVAGVTGEGVRTFYNHEVVGSRIANKICDRFHLSKDDKDKVFKLVRWHQFSVGENQTDKAVRRFIKNVGIENIENMMDLRIGDRLGGGLQEAESWRLKLFRQRVKEVLKKPFTVSDLKISGDDVMKVLNLKPGPEVGKILSELFEEVVEDSKKNRKDYLLSRLGKFKP